MRIMLVSAVAAALLGGTAASRAEEGPWCANVTIGRSGLIADCHYRTLEECVPNILAGNRGFCSENPRWPALQRQGAAHPKRQRRRHVNRD